MEALKAFGIPQSSERAGFKLFILFVVQSLVTTLLYLIAFSTQGWARVFLPEGNSMLSGLWTQCLYVTPRVVCSQLVGNNDATVGQLFAQAFATVGLITTFCSCVAILMFSFMKRFHNDKRVFMAFTFSTLFTALMLVLTCVCFVVGFNEHVMKLFHTTPDGYTYQLFYSFGLSVTAVILNIVSSLGQVVYIRRARNMIPF